MYCINLKSTWERAGVAGDWPRRAGRKCFPVVAMWTAVKSDAYLSLKGDWLSVTERDVISLTVEVKQSLRRILVHEYSVRIIHFSATMQFGAW